MKKTLFIILAGFVAIPALAQCDSYVMTVNTMVGTDMANTSSVGLYGKGSEEHGQTLPAVLVPNGQNFWTPQTQDTEQKCIAPYYYKDSQLQGFRNSHWLVGGCTQDYGSFTVATISGRLRLKPTERATEFSHEREESHPHYYKVQFDNERLTTEMTALSHASVFRVTAEADEQVHIVVNPNSDEGQGFIEIDTERKMIYGFNPVHRIYQGWGEPAGFAGHFILKYNDLPVDFGVKEGCAWLTFNAKKGQQIVLTTASSFTGKEGAIANHDAELAPCNYDFDQVAAACKARWEERFHAIEVIDDDTARVNQFYGAVYRASFLPHEVSDCDGRYPRFANGEAQNPSSQSTQSSLSSLRKRYGDFSMWDIYRAQLPLYNIITPTMSGEMMQSLVGMYEEGGWLPIFPCWNSYTAAMIGDHCSVALADAYVKGVRNFDAEKAYEAMRKNAFETPADFQDYKNGMGRRALDTYLKYGFVTLEDSVKEAFHTCEQTSRTLEYAFDDFAVAQMAKALNKKLDYRELMRRAGNWRNVINPKTGYADGRHADGRWENNSDQTSRVEFITEGATCHYTWYVPHDVRGLIRHMPNGRKGFEDRLNKLFDEHRYWHGNEPCHQVAYLFNYTREPWKTQRWIRNILQTEYNDTPGGLSGNDDAGQMSAWYVFSSIGFYPVCPATPVYEIGVPTFRKVIFHLENGRTFTISAEGEDMQEKYFKSASLNGKMLKKLQITHSDIIEGGELRFSF